jgi:glycyl-tRNA synthetase
LDRRLPGAGSSPSACPRAKLSLYPHPTEKLAHYSKGTTDIMFEFPFGVQELQGVAARGDFDLTQHSEVSGQKLDWFDEAAEGPVASTHVIEPSVGVDRVFLALLTTAYHEDEVEGESASCFASRPASPRSRPRSSRW